MYIFVVSFDSTIAAYQGDTGAQGAFSTEANAKKFMEDLAAMYNDTIEDEDCDIWRSIYYSRKGVYTIDRMTLDYMLDEYVPDNMPDDVDESNYDPYAGQDIYDTDDRF